MSVGRPPREVFTPKDEGLVFAKKNLRTSKSRGCYVFEGDVEDKASTKVFEGGWVWGAELGSVGGGLLDTGDGSLPEGGRMPSGGELKIAQFFSLRSILFFVQFALF
ncbi:hypothetical protein Salat_2554500 [Sesamum alatum]|uniref:Uncharacterized protein n=1 Tax=Sesamum alatum TaxID=300844 RepID=A0AAE2CCN6_9LAMI|nr:hypothetical protein Salat_2554500 [Sesamum alatum]